MKELAPKENSTSINAPRNLAANNFLSYLRSELKHRMKMNSSYSLRSFARQLQIEPSLLSKLLNGKRSLTSAMIERLAARLGVSEKSVQSFIQAQSVSDTYSALPLDHIRIIADWYHFAILELIKISPRLDADYISSSLGIDFCSAEEALARLQNLDYISKTQKGWQLEPARAQNTTTNHEFTSLAFQKLQEQILQQAAVAMKQTPLELRDQSSITMAISSSKIKKAKEKIKRFRRDLCQFLEADDEVDQVYQLSISLFPITKLNSKKLKTTESL